MEYVVLLHGLARRSNCMSVMEKSLEKEGYRSLNCDYPSTRHPIEELVNMTFPKLLEDCEPASRVHFVTHSMGGILVRQYLARNQIDKLGRVVMLGPPNQGSEVVDRLARLAAFKKLNGPAGGQLSTHQQSVPNELGRADFELGIIAGSRSVNPLLSTMLPGSNDGKVTVERTRLEGMQDHLVMPVTHPFMMKNKKVIAQVKHFLKYGEFSR